MLLKGECKVIGHPQNKVFRRRFSIPFSMFKGIVAAAREWPHGKGNITVDCTGIEGVPLELKILGALRMSAKGCSFDAIAELSGMSISTMHTFYHAFWERFVANFRDIWIFYPTDKITAADNVAVYARLGFPGAIGSVDCTHVYWVRCPAYFQNAYCGKEKKATVAYEVTVNHSGRCLYISTGHPGSRNDKTIVKTDKLVMDLREKKILQDVEFKLYKVYNPYRTQVLMLPLLLISLYQLLISLYLLLISLYLLLISLYQLLTSLYLLLISLYLFSYDLLPDTQFS
jgi:Plant transposon protein